MKPLPTDEIKKFKEFVKNNPCKIFWKTAWEDANTPIKQNIQEVKETLKNIEALSIDHPEDKDLKKMIEECNECIINLQNREIKMQRY